MPQPGDGQGLVRTHVLSMDPYMRRQMGGGLVPYANPPKLGDVRVGRGAGVVIQRRHPDGKCGEPVQVEFGWRERVVLDGCGLRKLLPEDLKPLSLSLGIVRQSAATALAGHLDSTSSQYRCSEQGLHHAGVARQMRQVRIGSHLARRDQALKKLMDWYCAGRLRLRETVAEAWRRLRRRSSTKLSGANIGKQVVRLAAAAE